MSVPPTWGFPVFGDVPGIGLDFGLTWIGDIGDDFD